MYDYNVFLHLFNIFIKEIHKNKNEKDKNSINNNRSNMISIKTCFDWSFSE